MLAAVTCMVDPNSTGWIVAIDGRLVFPILIGFRVAKDQWYSQPESAKPRVASTEILDQMETSLRELRRSIKTEQHS